MDEEAKVIEPEVLPPPRTISPRNALRKSAKTDEKHAAYLLLLEQGIDDMKAAQILGYNPRTAYALNKKLNAYERKKERLLSVAVKTTQNFAAGKPVNGITPKCSTVMRATEAILDREVPKVNVNISAYAEFMPIDLEKFE